MFFWLSISICKDSNVEQSVKRRTMRTGANLKPNPKRSSVWMERVAYGNVENMQILLYNDSFSDQNCIYIDCATWC